ncbi:hypothetical protein ACF5W4_15585 [Bacillota bacterium Lsc_1132]
MKNKKLFKWLLLVAALGIVFFVGFRFFGEGRWGHGELGAWQNRAAQMQPFQHGQGGMGTQMMDRGREFRHGNFMSGSRGERHFQGREGFELGGILFAFAAIFLGWLFRKNAGESIWRKWTGWLLIGIGALLLLAKVLPLVVLAVGAFVLYRLLKEKKNAKANWKVDETFESVTPVTSSTGALLDEWERNIKKEDK